MAWSIIRLDANLVHVTIDEVMTNEELDEAGRKMIREAGLREPRAPDHNELYSPRYEKPNQ